MKNGGVELISRPYDNWEGSVELCLSSVTTLNVCD